MSKTKGKTNSNSRNIENMATYMLAEEPEADKTLYSSYSAYSALMSIYPYTGGKTRAEIEEIFGVLDAASFKASQRDYGESGNDWGLLKRADLFLIDNVCKLNTANVKDFVFKDLQAPEIVDYVNGYVEQRTNNMIKSMITKPFSDGTKAVLLDTLYFKDIWFNQFDAAATHKATFYGTKGEQQVDMMYQEAYFEVIGLDLIRLPFANTPIVLEIKKDSGYDKLIDFTAYALNHNLESDSHYGVYDKVRLWLPKFEIETFGSIKSAYERMGIKSLFNAGADISKLSDDIYISDVLQKAKIRVEETGTEAAAVTMATAEFACAREDKDVRYLDFKVDHPFMYVLRDTEKDEVLFTGFVNNMPESV